MASDDILAKYTAKTWKNNFWTEILSFTDFKRRLDTIYVVGKCAETIWYIAINFRFFRYKGILTKFLDAENPYYRGVGGIPP